MKLTNIVRKTFPSFLAVGTLMAGMAFAPTFSYAQQTRKLTDEELRELFSEKVEGAPQNPEKIEEAFSEDANKYFTPEFIEEYGKELNEIGYASGEKRLQAYSSLSEFSLEFRELYIPELSQISQVAGSKTDIAFQDLPVDLMYGYYEELVQISQAAGERTAWAYHSLPIELMDGYYGELVQISQAAGERTGEAYRHLPIDLMDEHADALVQIAEAAEDETGLAYKSLPIDLMDEHADALVQIAEAAEFPGIVFEHLPTEFLGDYDDALIQIARVERGLALGFKYRNFSANIGKLDEHPKIEERYGDYSWAIVAALGHNITKEELELRPYLQQLVEMTRIEAEEPEDIRLQEFIDKHMYALTKIVRAVGAGTPEMYEHFPADLMDEHSRELVQIAEAAGSQTEFAYAYLPRELMDEHAQEIADIAEKCKEGTWAVFSRFGSRTLEFQDIIKKNKQLFGISNVNRYLPGAHITDKDIVLLEENIRNLDPEYNADKPIALVILNQNDWNGAFADQERIYNNLEDLTEGYKLFVFETDNEHNVFAAIEKIGILYWLDNEGNPNKPIELLVLGGHGNQYTLNLGRTPYNDKVKQRRRMKKYDERYLDIRDKNQFAEIEGYIADGGRVVLVSCSTAKGGEDSINLVNVIHDSIPHAYMYGPEVATHIRRFVFDENNLVTDVKYLCSDEQVLKLEPEKVSK